MPSVVLSTIGGRCRPFLCEEVFDLEDRLEKSWQERSLGLWATAWRVVDPNPCRIWRSQNRWKKFWRYPLVWKFETPTKFLNDFQVLLGFPKYAILTLLNAFSSVSNVFCFYVCVQRVSSSFADRRFPDCVISRAISISLLSHVDRSSIFEAFAFMASSSSLSFFTVSVFPSNHLILSSSLVNVYYLYLYTFNL